MLDASKNLGLDVSYLPVIMPGKRRQGYCTGRLLVRFSTSARWLSEDLKTSRRGNMLVPSGELDLSFTMILAPPSASPSILGL